MASVAEKTVKELQTSNDCLFKAHIVRHHRLVTDADIIVYTIQVESGADSWTVEHRFSDFESLLEELQNYVAKDKLPELPPKTWSAHGSTEESFLAERQAQLEKFLQDIIQVNAAHRNKNGNLLAVRNFLKLDRHVSNLTQKPPAATFTESTSSAGFTQSKNVATKDLDELTKKVSVMTTDPVTGKVSETTAGLDIASITADAIAQIETQKSEALKRSEQLKQADIAKLSSTHDAVLIKLEQEARELQDRIEKEKTLAMQDVAVDQTKKLAKTETRAAEEQAAITKAAELRKKELETKALKLQKEIEELVKRKTAEMLKETPGDLQFTHISEDAHVKAGLVAAVGHTVDQFEQKSAAINTTHGENIHNPVITTKTYQDTTQTAAASELHQVQSKVETQHLNKQHYQQSSKTAEAKLNA